MKKITTIATALALSTLASAAFAQGATGNMNAPSMNSTGTGVTQPGTSSTGQAVDRPHTSGSMGTTGSATTGNNANSGMGSNSATSPQTKGGNGGAH